jgi:hypothetical protein
MWLFRLPAIVYFIAAALLLAGGVAMYVQDQANEAAKAKALTHEPPAEVALEAYDPAKNKSDYDEVVVLAQLDLDSMVEVTKTKRGVERDRATIGRLYPVGASDKSAPAPALLVADGTLSDEQLKAMMVPDKQGAFGPIVKINGREGSAGHYSAVSKATESGPPVAENVLYIEPFQNGRTAALAAAPMGEVFLGAGGVGALLLAGFGFFRRQRDRANAG